MKSYAKLTSALIAVWFLAALSASALGAFQNDQAAVGISVAIAAVTPLLIFALWFGGSRQFREWTLTLNPETLTFAQTWRVLGLVFVVLEAHRLLPAMFAWPAGYGDIFIGVTAGAVAFKWTTPNHRGAFIFWQVLGITDLVLAVGLGTTARLFAPQAATMLPM